MDGLYGAIIAAVVSLTPVAEPANWCTVGTKVMVPDGREGLVTSVDGVICRVLADGEAYVSLIPHFLVEPLYPQDLVRRTFGH